MSIHRCHNCGKTRANITVVSTTGGQRDLCPECAADVAREAQAQWRLDIDRVQKVLGEQDVRRQTRTIAKLSRLDANRTLLILRTLALSGEATYDQGLWTADNA